MFDTFKNRLEITGTLWTVTALRISAGRSSEPIGSDLPVIKDALGKPLIPGSSFKGALRSRLESFLRAIDPTLAANPCIESEWSIPANSIRNEQRQIIKKGIDAFKEDVEEELKNDPDKNRKRDNLFTTKIIENTDFVSLIFGSSWIASKFQVRDLTVVSDAWFGQYQERDGVSIDRDTETAADGKLYDYQVVPAGTPFHFHAVVENAEEAQLGLLMVGLRLFQNEQIPLGGGCSRGLGVVRLDIDKKRWVNVEGNPKLLLEYMQKLVWEDDTAYEDATDHEDHWVQKLKEKLEIRIKNSEVKI